MIYIYTGSYLYIYTLVATYIYTHAGSYLYIYIYIYTSSYLYIYRWLLFAYPNGIHPYTKLQLNCKPIIFTTNYEQLEKVYS